MIHWSDFEKIDIRTGKIVSAEPFPEAKKPAYRLRIDFGELGLKNSSAQITTLYQPENLIGMNILAVVNFPPKQVGPFLSEVLVLGAVQPDGKVILLTTERETPAGTRIA